MVRRPLRRASPTTVGRGNLSAVPYVGRADTFTHIPKIQGQSLVYRPVTKLATRERAVPVTGVSRSGRRSTACRYAPTTARRGLQFSLALISERAQRKRNAMANIADIEGIGPANAKKLGDAGVKSTGALLKAAGAKAGRKELSTKTGIGEANLLEWVNRADLFRVKGVGTQYSDLLEAAGVDSPLELSKRRADNLAKAMNDANTKGAKKLVRRPPTESMVQAMIDSAKTLDKAVFH